jgi:dephospho-CoA kinase
MIIGLTGGIASGKSTVSNYLSTLKIPIIDADKIAREVVSPGHEGFNKIVDFFGVDILEEGLINRSKLRKLVFNDSKALSKLNEITHPLIRNIIVKKLNQAHSNHHSLVILDAPLLLENNLEVLVDEVWLVWVNLETQIKRLTSRDAMNKIEAEKMIRHQMSLKEKKKRAHILIDNNHSKEDLYQQLDELVKARREKC